MFGRKSGLIPGPETLFGAGTGWVRGKQRCLGVDQGWVGDGNGLVARVIAYILAFVRNQTAYEEALTIYFCSNIRFWMFT